MDPILSISLAALAVFVVAEIAYTVDHYLVHHDKERYRATHGRHHRRYGGPKNAAHLDAYERSTYFTAGIVSVAITSVASLMSGNPGFVLGAALKFVHSLAFHLYQHAWWGPVNVRKQGLGRPARGWGIASARYHAFHHSNPDDATFTYCESWQGLDRILEWAHPWLVRLTADGMRRARERDADLVGERGESP